MSEIKFFFEIAGGLSLILYGIHLSGINLQKILGSKLEDMLKKSNKNPVRGLATGTAITGMIHSSGTTTVMLIGLITGGFMTLSGAIPVMLGANIGSTIATQLASLRIGSYALAFLTMGVLLHISAEKKINKRIGEATIGFSFLFLGMEFLYSGIDSISENPLFLETIKLSVNSPLSAILLGAIITVLFRSASTISILVVTLGATGSIELSSALYMILGINFGSSLKVVSLALRGKNFSGKLALIHIMFNSFGLVLFLIFFGYFESLIQVSSVDTGRQIANAHTFYNLISAIFFIPFTPLIIRFVEKISPANKSIKKTDLFYLDKKLICTPSVSLSQVNRGMVEMAKIAHEMLESSKMILFEGKDLIKNIQQRENRIDNMTEKSSEYMVQISQQNLSRPDMMKLYSMMHIVAEIEHLCDHISDVSEIFEAMKDNKKFTLSEKAKGELIAVFGKLGIMQNLVIKSLDENNVKLANEIIQHENKVDEIIKKINNNHALRMQEGNCTEEAGKYFSEILYNLERIGDHYDNIAYAIVDRFKHNERI